MASAMTNNPSSSMGRAGRSTPSGGTKATAPTRDHGMPKGGSPAASGKFGPIVGMAPSGKGNNDKHKPK